MGKPGAGIVIKDAIADITLQQVLTRPEDFDVIATLNLNGDYLSDALAAQVGGIGIAPGGNINYITGHAVFEATHGTAPKYANQDKVNPGSVILSGEMMFRYMGWTEAADLILKGLERRDREQTRDLRFRATDGRRDGNQMFAVRRQCHRAHVIAARGRNDEARMANDERMTKPKTRNSQHRTMFRQFDRFVIPSGFVMSKSFVICLLLTFVAAIGSAFRREAQHYRKRSVRFRLDWRPASFAGRIARGICARDGQREEGRLQYVHLDCADRRRRRASSTDKRRSRFRTAVVAGWKIFALSSRD